MNRKDLSTLLELLGRLYEETDDPKVRDRIERVHDYVDELEDQAYREGKP